jgi:hypothetical protein
MHQGAVQRSIETGEVARIRSAARIDMRSDVLLRVDQRE